MTYEMRTYTAVAGKMDGLLSRFRDHTIRIFPGHGMESIGYWVKAENPEVLVYLLRHHGDPERNWASFQADPEWIEAKAASITGGQIVADVQSTFLQPTDFSTLS